MLSLLFLTDLALLPYSSHSRSSEASFCQGVLNLIFARREVLLVKEIACFQGPVSGQLSRNSGFSGFGMSFSGSSSHDRPIPRQAWHAPKRLLNENERGSSSGRLAPHCTQTMLSENSVSVPSSATITTRPSASSEAVRIDSRMRFSLSGLTATRSTTTSMVCSTLRLSFTLKGNSSNRSITPSMRAVTKPFRA